MNDTTRTVALSAPFEDSWVRIQTEPKMRLWIDMRTKVAATFTSPTLEAIEDCLTAAATLIVEHNLLDVETGKPLTVSFAEMSPGQIKGILAALVEVFITGESADPLVPPTTPKQASSPKPSSTRRRSRSASPSGSSPMATP